MKESVGIQIFRELVCKETGSVRHPQHVITVPKYQRISWTWNMTLIRLSLVSCVWCPRAQKTFSAMSWEDTGDLTEDWALILKRILNKLDSQCTYNTEGRSFSHLCTGKSIRITYSECVFEALGIVTFNASASFCHLWPVRLYNIFPYYVIQEGFSWGGGRY